MKSRGFSESHSIPYGKVRILGFLEAPQSHSELPRREASYGSAPRQESLFSFSVDTSPLMGAKANNDGRCGQIEGGRNFFRQDAWPCAQFDSERECL
jgi:hypothetical protein